MYYDATLPWEEPIPQRVHQSTDRLAYTPTIASLAARHPFDAQVCHLRFLQYFDDKVVPSRFDANRDADLAMKRMKTPIRRVRPGSTSTKSSSSDRPSTEHAATRPTTAATERPQTAGNPRPGNDFSRRYYLLHLGYKHVNEPDMDEIMTRVSRPTTASTGGRNLAGKNYDTYQQPETKTYKRLPHIETRFRGSKSMSQEEYDSILDRLTRPTKSSHWKVRSVPDPNSHPPRRMPGDYGRHPRETGCYA